MITAILEQALCSVRQSIHSSALINIVIKN